MWRIFDANGLVTVIERGRLTFREKKRKTLRSAEETDQVQAQKKRGLEALDKLDGIIRDEGEGKRLKTG